METLAHQANTQGHKPQGMGGTKTKRRHEVQELNNGHATAHGQGNDEKVLRNGTNTVQRFECQSSAEMVRNGENDGTKADERHEGHTTAEEPTYRTNQPTNQRHLRHKSQIAAQRRAFEMTA